MQTEQVVQTVSVKAAEALSTTKRFINETGNYCGQGEKAIGVLSAKASLNEMAPINSYGIMLVESGGVISSGAMVTSDSLGRAVEAKKVLMNNVSLAAVTFSVDPLVEMTIPVGETSAPVEAVNGIAHDAASGAGEFIRILKV